MRFTRQFCAAAAGTLLLLAACDDDPSQPTEALSLLSCPTVTDVNAPLTLNFSVPILPTTIGGSSIVVSSGASGLEIPGTATIDPTDPRRVLFTSSDPFRFDEPVRLRVQNLRSTATGTQVNVTVCDFRTPLPPITELFWTELPRAGGNRILSASLVAPDQGYPLSESGVLSFGGELDEDFVVIYQEPRYLAGFDVDFISTTRGFATMSNYRRGRTELIETRNGGTSFDSLTSIIGDNLTRIRFLPSARPAPNDYFNVIGGGSTFETTFYKYLADTDVLSRQPIDPAGGTTVEQQSGQVQDLDVRQADTARVAAVTAGVEVGLIDVRGQLFVSTDGGNAWRRIPGVRAGDSTQTFWGVAILPNGDIFITGGNGYVARVSGAFGTGAVTVDASLTQRFAAGTAGPAGTTSPPIRSIDEENPNALIYTDVEFAPDNPQKGWIIGAQLLGVVDGVPRYQGLLFETRDGGQNWIRQGVAGANNYGAEFPRLNRLEVFSAQAAWAVGEGGTVLRYTPQSTTQATAQP